MRFPWTGRKKFFNEVLGKYDARYYRSVVPASETIDRLLGGLAAFMRLAEAEDVHPVIAHGTLIGWWWSRRPLPWDEDIDLLLPYDELCRLTPWSGTRIEECWLFEINPNHVHATRNRTFHDQRERNRIDARVIDVETGIFIDITALRRRPDGRLATKCPHVFEAEWLYPLRPSTFADVPVFVPARVEHTLAYEYGAQVLMLTRFNGHVFDTADQRWKPEVT